MKTNLRVKKKTILKILKTEITKRTRTDDD